MKDNLADDKLVQKRGAADDEHPAAESIQSIPLAATQPNVSYRFGRFSNFWWLTVLSLIAAIALVWWSLPDPGLMINVKFPEGHGLKAEDRVLYRGIEVGHVDDVQLSDDHSGIDVTIALNESASDLARQGTEFWIVRPKLSITEISGLETAVGHKYVALEPGPEGGKRVLRFEGLVNAPILDRNAAGIEIVIRGDQRRSVSAGSPVNFRGVEVGRVMSVGLSPDSRYVDIRARIYERYQDYLTTSSRFWANAGVDVDFSLGKGLSVDTESLKTLAQGGLSFLTINNSGQPVGPGHVFKLYKQVEDEWLTAANQVAATNIELGGVTTIVKTWRQKALLGRRSRDLAFNGIPCSDRHGDKFLLVPSGAMQLPDKAVDGNVEFLLLTRTSGRKLTDTETKLQPLPQIPDLGMLPFSDAPDLDWLKLPGDFREPEMPEDVFAVRASMDDGQLAFLHYYIDKSFIRDDWTVPTFDGDGQLWNGSPLLSAADGKVVGILLVAQRNTRMIPFNSAMFAK